MKKSLPVLPTAIAGISLLALTAVAVNSFVGSTRFGSERLDLTQHKVYTLSEGTENILTKLDTPVTLRFYFTEGSRALPRNIKLYATRVRDFLKQYETLAKGKVKLEIIDVQPDTDAEDSARLDGIRSQEVSVTESVYFGLSVSCLDRKQALPVLDPQQESLLEYQISRAITQVMRESKPKLGVLTSLPMQGNGMPPQMGGQPGWIIYQQLQADYDMVTVAKDAKEIPSDITALLVVHPSPVSPETEFAIDQYLLKGGKAAIFLDSQYYFNPAAQQQNPMMQQQAPIPPSSTLPTLLKAWGMNFESGLVVADQTNRFTRQNRVMTGVSSFSGEGALDTSDPVTAQIANVFMVLPGGFSGEPAAGLQKNPLVYTTTNTQLFDGMRSARWDQKLLTETPLANKAYDMVVRLKGKFPTAFPNGNPSAATPAEGEKKDEAKATALKEASAEGAVVLFADVDMIADQGAFEQNPMVPQMVQPYNGNFSLALNVLEQLTGDQNLIGARSRPSSRRPFKVLEDMQSKAEQRVSGEMTAIQTKIEETQQKINEMAAAQSKESGKLKITREMQAEADKMNAQLVDANKRLREIQKDLAKEKDSLEAKLTWANILVMPIVVAMAGLLTAMFRRGRTAAR